jgi:hypothetical protein
VFDRQSQPEWRKARRCEAGGCVEVAMTNDGVLMRDSTDSTGPILRFDRQEWSSFIESIRRGII